eukprot:5940191-Alexandrium_andersonii.AAC.1
MARTPVWPHGGTGSRRGATRRVARAEFTKQPAMPQCLDSGELTAGSKWAPWTEVQASPSASAN